jgi:hypothetical protein
MKSSLNPMCLPVVDLPRAERNEVRAPQSGTAKRTVTGTTLPTSPVCRQTITPLFRGRACFRERNCVTIW